MLMYKPLTVTLTVVVMLDELEDIEDIEELEELDELKELEEPEELEVSVADVIRFVISFIFPTLFQFISSRF